MYTIKYIMPHIPSKITIPHIIIGNWYWTSASPSYCTTVKALMRDRPESVIIEYQALQLPLFPIRQQSIQQKVA